VRREGVWLAIGVMVLDSAATRTGNWPGLRADPARLLGLDQDSLLPLTLFGLFVLLSSRPVLRVMKG
jgi:hypothetical protein